MRTNAHCNYCERFRAGGKCEAFPEGISEPILSGQVPHDRPYPGDHGIEFEPRKNLTDFDRQMMSLLDFKKAKIEEKNPTEGHAEALSDAMAKYGPERFDQFTAYLAAALDEGLKGYELFEVAHHAMQSQP